MKTECTFTVEEFSPTDLRPEIETAVSCGVSHMVKRLEGAVEGRAITQFTAAFDHDAGVGTYLAMESFVGTVDGHPGAFNFAHSATTLGTAERHHEFFVIVPGSGTGELAGIRGTGQLLIDPDGTHRFVFDYDLDR